ncbi:hypothetical protein Btru_059414 [Bulinus truncatus]|nr:hypothetical protein Btru_059414 [Bulinus truncatus]
MWGFQTPSWIDDPLIGVPPSAMENKNTHRKTGADMRILTAYMRSLHEMRLPEAIPPDELDNFQNELNITDKHPPDPDGREGIRSFHDLTDRQDSECEVKMEALEDGDDEGNSDLAVDFTQEQRDLPLDVSQ